MRRAFSYEQIANAATAATTATATSSAANTTSTAASKDGKKKEKTIISKEIIVGEILSTSFNDKKEYRNGTVHKMFTFCVSLNTEDGHISARMFLEDEDAEEAAEKPMKHYTNRSIKVYGNLKIDDDRYIIEALPVTPEEEEDGKISIEVGEKLRKLVCRF